MVICLERGADLHMAQLMPLPLTVSCFSKVKIGLPFWYRLTWVVPEKGPLNGCVCGQSIGSPASSAAIALLIVRCHLPNVIRTQFCGLGPQNRLLLQRPLGVRTMQ